ncbi:RNA polymerase sigma factor [Myxococcota bacterium]
MSPAEEHRLVLKALDGSARAFDELLRAHERPLFRHLRRLLPTDDDAHDALQQTFMAIVRGLRNLRRCELFRPWAYGVATRVALRTLSRRRPRARESEEVEEQLLDMTPSPERLAETSERREALLEKVLMLSPPVRSVILLHFYEGLSLQQVAAALEISLGTIKSRLNAGLQKLRSLEEVRNHV